MPTTPIRDEWGRVRSWYRRSPMIPTEPEPIIPRMTRLQIYRLHAGLTVEGLARLANEAVDIIQGHEAGELVYSGPTFVLRHLADALDVERERLAQTGENCYRDLWEGGGEVWVKEGEGWRVVREESSEVAPPLTYENMSRSFRRRMEQTITGRFA